jgi:hypothetical protein
MRIALEDPFYNHFWFYCKFRGRIVCKTSYLIGIKDFEVFFMSLTYYAYK